MSSPTSDHPRAVAKSAFSFLSGTALSRISGLGREMAMAIFFGVNPSVAAFLVAFRLANLFRRMFGEGALLNGFIPYFESLRNENAKRAAEFFRDTFFSLLFLLIALIGTIEMIFHLASCLCWISSENLEILHLMQIILPGIIFISLFGLCTGLLQCEKTFFLSAVSPIGLNAIWIVSVWLFKDRSPEEAVIGLSFAIIFGFFCQWIFILPKTIGLLRRSLSWKDFLRVRLFSYEIRKMLSFLSLGIVGVAATQINTALDTIFARFASLEGPAYLNYAIHLQQLPLALFGIAISSALLPPLSRAFEANDAPLFHRLLEFSLSTALFILLPCTFGIFTLGGAGVNLLFGRGQFTATATTHTIVCLWNYGIGLIPMAVSLLLAPAFYAKKDFRTPLNASLISIAINFFLNTLFVLFLKWGPETLALSTSISALCNAILLYRNLCLTTGARLSRPFFFTILHTAACSILATIGTLYIGRQFLGDPTLPLLFGQEVQFLQEWAAQALQFTALFLLFSTTFFIAALLFKNNSLTQLLESFIRKASPRTSDE